MASELRWPWHPRVRACPHPSVCSPLVCASPRCAHPAPHERIQLVFGEPGGKLRQQPAPCMPGGRGPSSGGPVSRQLSHTQPGIAAGFLRRGTAGTGSAPPPGWVLPPHHPKISLLEDTRRPQPPRPAPAHPAVLGQPHRSAPGLGAGWCPPGNWGAEGSPVPAQGQSCSPQRSRFYFYFFIFWQVLSTSQGSAEHPQPRSCVSKRFSSN